MAQQTAIIFWGGGVDEGFGTGVYIYIVGNNEVALTETAREFNICGYVLVRGVKVHCILLEKILMLEHLSGWQRAYEGTF